MTGSDKTLFTVESAAVRAGGVLVSGNGNRFVSSVCIDSRDVRKDSLFVALKGENTDGHRFILQALEAGASAVMFSDDQGTVIPETHKSAGFIRVEDTLEGLQKLAASRVADFPGLTKIAVTGSNGKTTTKEILGAILSCENATVMNRGNLNSETGLPLSVMNIDTAHVYGVFEMGINHPGEMKALAGVLKPDLALITNIGSAHIGLMGSRQAIAEQKADVFSFFSRENTGFIPSGSEWGSLLEKKCPGNIVRYSVEDSDNITGIKNLGLDGWEFLYKGESARFKLVGRHNLENMAGAVAVAEKLGVAPENIRKGISTVVPVEGRGQILRGRYTVIEDSYNANNESMSGILDFVDGLEWTGRFIAVLGAMKELGSSSGDIHKNVAEKALSLNPDVLFLFGEEMESVYMSIKGRTVAGSLVYETRYENLEQQVLSVLEEGDLVLLKASRAMGLDRLAAAISKKGDHVNV